MMPIHFYNYYITTGEKMEEVACLDVGYLVLNVQLHASTVSTG